MNRAPQHADDIRITYDRAGRPGPHRHPVRTSLEADLCAWLLDRGIAHRHAPAVFTVLVGARPQPLVYVPDIVLHDPGADGRQIILEPYQVHVPKEGGTRLLAAFRREYGSQWFLLLLARRQDMRNLDPGSYDVLADASDFGALLHHLPVPR